VTLLVWLNTAVLAYFLVANTFYAVLLTLAALELRSYKLVNLADSRWRLLQSENAPVLSMLVPAHNEAATIVESARAMLGLYYPNLEIVVINDGSTDLTVQMLTDHFDLVETAAVFRQVLPTEPVLKLYRSRLHPMLVVVDKVGGGKADALNAGLNVAAGRLVCALDADTVVEPVALQQLVWPFLTNDDMLAAGGTIRVANGSEFRRGRVTRVRTPRRALPGFQVVEYVRAFLFGRLGWNRLGGNLIVSGAFGLFDRRAMLDAGGYVPDTVGEDMELAVRLRRHSYELGRPGKVAFIADPVAWTEAPSTFRQLARQRDRWHRGLADVLWRHRRMMLNPRYGTLGLIGYPYFLFVELLGPVVEAIGLLGLAAGLLLGAVDGAFAVLFFLAAYGFGLCLTAFAISLEEFGFHRSERVFDRLLLLGWATLEPLGYRQLTVVWRLRGLYRYLRNRSDWGAQSRTGFAAKAPPATVVDLESG
jgi:cellulose synthase/poly-beta-1,6-N-acetylglucosamine synthase-like glycosyltransferase